MSVPEPKKLILIGAKASHQQDLNIGAGGNISRQ